MKTTGNTIILSGGGQGIGKALAHRWHDAGNTVIISGRNAERLKDSVAGRENLHALSLDVTDSGSIAAFRDEVLERFPATNVLVNNAGIMIYEDASASRNLTDARAMLDTNVMGLIALTDAFVDHLSATPDSVLVNVSSGLAFVPLAKAATYSATKAFVHSYTQSLRALLNGKVEVIELAPPGVRTNLTPGQADREAYMKLDDYADEVMALFARTPTAQEILVENVKPLRFAERDGKVDALIGMLLGR